MEDYSNPPQELMDGILESVGVSGFPFEWRVRQVLSEQQERLAAYWGPCGDGSDPHWYSEIDSHYYYRPPGDGLTVAECDVAWFLLGPGG